MKTQDRRLRIAVLIPAFREETVIQETLKSILAAGMSPEDIYVIDDASPDATGEIAQSCGVHVLRNEVNMGKAGGVRNALVNLRLLDRYTHVAFLDADTLVDRRYFAVVKDRLRKDLRECDERNVHFKNIPRFMRKPIGVLSGRAKSIPCNWITAFRAYEYWLTHEIHKPAQSKLKALMVAPGCASTYTVSALRHVVWTDRTMTEDMDSTIQAALAGERIAYEHDAIVYTQDPNTFKGYVGQIWRRWYAGTWQVMGIHGLLWRGWFSSLHWDCRMMTLEPLLYLGGLGWTLASHPKYFGFASVLMFLTTLALALVGAWRERRWDIAKWSWIYAFILTMNLLFFVGSSWNIFGRNKKSRSWYSVERYQLQ